jgi:hypothetical protein
LTRREILAADVEDLVVELSRKLMMSAEEFDVKVGPLKIDSFLVLHP